MRRLNIRNWALAASALPWLCAFGVCGGCQNNENPNVARQDARDRRVIEVLARDYRFEPSRIEVDAGQPLAARLVNRGEHPHNIEFELPAGEKEFQRPVPPGQSDTLRFSAPSEPGEYVVYCPIANHRERGMTGTLVVRRAR